MKAIHLFAAFMLTGASLAVAQTTPPTQPGGNVPTVQGPCGRGYEAAVVNGRMELGPETMKAVDTDNDGRVSKAEFDSACTKKLFDQSEKMKN